MTRWPSKSTLQRPARSCRFALHNIRKIRPFLTEHVRNFLSRPLSFLGWTTAMLFWLVFHQTQSNPLQMIQNAAARLVFNEPKRTHVTPLFISLHWLPVAARIKFKTLMLAYRTTTGSAPSYFTHYYESTSPPEVWDLLVSDALWYHHREAQNHSPEHSHSPFLDGGIIFPPLSGMLDPCQSSSNNWRLISFGTTWLPKLVLKKKKKKKPFPLSFSPSLASLYLFEQWLRLGVYEHSSVLIASSRWIALCTPQL